MYTYLNLSWLKWLEDTQFIDPKNQKRVRCEARMGTRQHCYRKEAARAVICHRQAGEHVAKLYRSFKMIFFFGGYMRTRQIFSSHVVEGTVLRTPFLHLMILVSSYGHHNGSKWYFVLLHCELSLAKSYGWILLSHVAYFKEIYITAGFFHR